MLLFGFIQKNNNNNKNHGHQRHHCHQHHDHQHHHHHNSAIARVPEQNGISEACYIVEIHHSGTEPSKFDYLLVKVEQRKAVVSSSSSRSLDGNSSLLNEGGSTSQVPQATVQLAGYGSVVWPDFLSE